MKKLKRFTKEGQKHFVDQHPYPPHNEDDEPHQIVKHPMGKVVLKFPEVSQRVKNLLEELHKGEDVEIDSLDILDALLQTLTPMERWSVEFHKGDKIFNGNELYYFRFQRGLDVRPKN
jgi:hypothetical protein